MLTELDARLSRVTRWTVIKTLQVQSVAEHCFNVERIARRIAVEWVGINDHAEIDHLSQMALHHDDDEAITGDIPSPVKPLLSEGHLDASSRAWYNEPGLLHDIVQLADKMEAYRLLTMEKQLGNRYVERYRHELKGKLWTRAKILGIDVIQRTKEWMDSIEQMEGTTYGGTVRGTEGGA